VPLHQFALQFLKLFILACDFFTVDISGQTFADMPAVIGDTLVNQRIDVMVEKI
jgi:hypothetical protein